jgi:hypothetical protein
MSVQASHDPKTDFNKYHTYAWANRAPASEAVGRPGASLLDQLVKEDADQQLPTKGLNKATDSPPDLLISYSGRSTTAVEYGATPGPAGWYEYQAPTPYTIQKGSLTMVFLDAKTGKPVWQGTVSDAIGDAGPSQEQIASAVKELIKKYPEKS